jgi:integrase
VRLTKPVVDKLAIPAGKAEALFFDDALAGFGVRLRAGGKKVWILQFRVGTQQRRITIGSLQALDLETARTEARRLLAKAQLGHDPQAEKQEARAQAAQTLKANIGKYLASKTDKLRASTARETRRYLEVHWKPLHQRPLHIIGRGEISDQLDAIKAQRGASSSDRARAALSGFFVWAMKRGLVSSNPVAVTERPATPTSRDRVLTDGELVEIWQAAGAGDYEKIIRLLILLGQRREEVAGMVWPELSLPRKLWSLPAARTKNGRTHDVPLPDAAVRIIETVHRRNDRQHLFGEGEGGFSGWSRAKAALDKRILVARQKAAINGDAKPMPAWRLHDLRRTAATRMADNGVAPHVIESVLNHVSGHKGGVAGVYNRSAYTDETRAALDLWAARVLKLSEGL